MPTSWNLGVLGPVGRPVKDYYKGWSQNTQESHRKENFIRKSKKYFRNFDFQIFFVAYLWGAFCLSYNRLMKLRKALAGCCKLSL
jgi:hypothetical protein